MSNVGDLSLISKYLHPHMSSKHAITPSHSKVCASHVHKFVFYCFIVYAFLCSIHNQAWCTLNSLQPLSDTAHRQTFRYITWTHSHSVKWPESHREGRTDIRGLWWGFLSESLFSHLSLFWPLSMLWSLRDHTHKSYTAKLNLLEMTGHVRTSLATVMRKYDTTLHNATCTHKHTHTISLLWSISKAISPSMPPEWGIMSECGSDPK